MTKNHKKSTIISTASDKPKAKDARHYVSNADLYQEFVKWYDNIKLAEEQGKPEPPIPNSIGLAFIQIAENLSKKSNWLSNTKWKTEMVGNAIENCVRYAKNFNPAVTKNPFAYFTQICYYAFLRTIRFEKINDYVKHKSMLNVIANNIDTIQTDEEFDVEFLDYNQEGIEDFIKEFEIKNFGQELALDETAGLAGKRRNINKDKKEENYGFF